MSLIIMIEAQASIALDVRKFVIIKFQV